MLKLFVVGTAACVIMDITYRGHDARSCSRKYGQAYETIHTLPLISIHRCYGVEHIHVAFICIFPWHGIYLRHSALFKLIQCGCLQ